MKTNGHGLVRALIVAVTVASFIEFAACQGSDWPHYRGPNHDGVSSDRIITNWPAEGPRQLWKIPLTGRGSFAVSGGQAYALSNRTIAGKWKEVCIAFEADTGAELWVSSALSSTRFPTGTPNSTPAVDGNRVFVLSSDLKLLCLDANTGQIIWQKDLVSDFNAAPSAFGNGVSPTIEGNLVIVAATAKGKGMFLAFQKTDGTFLWALDNFEALPSSSLPADFYATPIAVTIAGVRQIIFCTRVGLTSIAPDSGNVVWGFSPSKGTDDPEATPVVSGDVVVFGGRTPPLWAVQISKADAKFVVRPLWSQTDNSINWSSPVCQSGYLYGLFRGAGSEILRCIELATGKVMWSQQISSSIYSGGLLIADGRLLVLTFDGALLLVQCNPVAYTELARTQVLTGDCYNHPAICDGRVYARSTSEAVCLDLAEKVTLPLKLALPLRQPKDHFELLVGDTAGSSLSAQRISQIELRTTTNLNLPVTNWLKLTNAVVMTNGILQLDDSNSTRLPQRFFLGIENQ